jgi:hypothetical protein
MKLGYVAVVVAAWGVAGCSSVKPVAINAGEPCYRCQRVIEEPKMAAELVDDNGQARKFKTPACLATFLKDNPDEKAHIYVTDYASGELFPVQTALFVRIKLSEGEKVERDFVAFKNLADAKAAAEMNTSRAVDWAAVRAHVSAPPPPASKRRS